MVALAICMAALAFWPGPSGLIDWIAVPIRAHMPPDAKLIAVGVFSPFFIPLKVLAMTALVLSLPAGCTRSGLLWRQGFMATKSVLPCR